jgi:uncharacterized membrane protein/YHS domain-containing protein
MLLRGQLMRTTCRQLLILPTLLVVCGALAFSARVSAAEEVRNPMCPVLTDEATDPDVWVKYQGRKVWFCCQKCKRKFLADPQPYLAALPQFAAAAAKTPATAKPVAAGKAPPAAETPSATAPAPKPAKWISFVGRFHPIIVHFPIALLLVALLAEVLFMATGRPVFASATRFLLPLAALGAVTAALLGWAAASGAHFPAELDEVLDTHGDLGLNVAIFSVAVAILREWDERRPGHKWLRWLYRVGLFATAVLVGVTGYYGGVLVYGAEHFQWPS